MIYFIICSDSLSAANDFARLNYTVTDGDNEFQIKIDLSDLEKFKSIIENLKSSGKTDLIQLIEDWCPNLESDGEEIPIGLEDEILEILN